MALGPLFHKGPVGPFLIGLDACRHGKDTSCWFWLAILVIINTDRNEPFGVILRLIE